MNVSIIKENLNEICLAELEQPYSLEKIQEFIEDINISGFVICKHPKCGMCKSAIYYGSEVFCKSKIINSLNHNC